MASILNIRARRYRAIVTLLSDAMDAIRGRRHNGNPALPSTSPEHDQRFGPAMACSGPRPRLGFRSPAADLK